MTRVHAHDECMHNVLTNDGEIVLIGDFNLNYLNPTSATKHFQQTTKSFHLKQTITEPTRITEETRTLIDLFLTSRPELYTCGVIPIGFSDHCAIFGVRKLHNIKRPPPKIIQSRNYKNYDPAFFSDDLNKIPWDILEMESTSNEAWIVFKDLFLTVADKHAPVATRRVRGFSVPWLTSSIKELMTERDYHHKKAIKTNQELHWSKYKRLRNTVSKKMKKAKSDYYSSRLTETQDPKTMWEILKEIMPNKKNAGVPKTDSLSALKFNHFFTSIAEKLCERFQLSTYIKPLTPRVNNKFSMEEVNEMFVCNELKRLKSKKATGLDGMSARLLKDAASVIAKPITYIINLTISTGEIPPELKEAKVTPIFKNGKRTEESNYRPISVLPLVSKVMERAIQVQLVKFLEANEVLSAYQSGFRKGHSTETAVTYLTDQILEHMDNQQMTGSVFIDLKKAFDLVNHNCLLQKLEHYGVRGKSLTWFQNYLGSRTQRVRFGQDLSPSLPIEYGVPQGSLLGPLLFVIYINDLPSCLKNTHISMYADDTVIYCSGANPKEIKKALQEDLERVVTWMDINRLILNKEKTKGILFGTRQRLEAVANFYITISGTNVEMVSKFTYLGVTLDEELKWKIHAEDVHKKVSKRLGLLRRIRSTLTLQAAQAVYKCIIEPIFSYADTAWGELPESSITSLQRLQNRAAKIVTCQKSTKTARNIVNWPDLETLRKIHKCILVYKCLRNFVPIYLKNYFKVNNDVHNYNTRQRRNIHPNKTNLVLGGRTFKNSGRLAFNSLPSRIKEASSLAIFKRLLKGHFI